MYRDVLCYKINILKFLKLTYYSQKYILHKIFFLCPINLRVFENRGMRRIFGCKREEVTVWKKKELPDKRLEMDRTCSMCGGDKTSTQNIS
jgi:hypothetical protein